MNSTKPGSTDRAEARCECGQLIAKLRNDGVELKCKRCKRIVVVPYSMARRDAGVVPNIHLRGKQQPRLSGEPANEL